MSAPNLESGESGRPLRELAMEVLQAAEDRRLAAVVDAVEQAHVVWLRPGEPVTPAAEHDSRAVVYLFMSGLAQVGDRAQMLSWRGGLAPGRRVLPTEAGRVLLEQYRHQRAVAQAATSLPAVDFWGSDHR